MSCLKFTVVAFTDGTIHNLLEITHNSGTFSKYFKNALELYQILGIARIVYTYSSMRFMCSACSVLKSSLTKCVFLVCYGFSRKTNYFDKICVYLKTFVLEKVKVYLQVFYWTILFCTKHRNFNEKFALFGQYLFFFRSFNLRNIGFSRNRGKAEQGGGEKDREAGRRSQVSRVKARGLGRGGGGGGLRRTGRKNRKQPFFYLFSNSKYWQKSVINFSKPRIFART